MSATEAHPTAPLLIDVLFSRVFAPKADSNVPVAPRPVDVLCGRGRAAFKHEGNQRLRDQILENVHAFSQASHKTQKTEIVRCIIAGVTSGGGRFLKRIKGGPRAWQLATYIEARQRVSHALRDAAANKVKSMPVLIKDSRLLKQSKGGRKDMDTNGQEARKMTGLPTKGLNRDQPAVPRETFHSILPIVVPDPPPAMRSSSLTGTSKDYASFGDCSFIPVTLEATTTSHVVVNNKKLHELHLPHLPLAPLLPQETTNPNVGAPPPDCLLERLNDTVPRHSCSAGVPELPESQRGSPSWCAFQSYDETFTLEESLAIFSNSSGTGEEIEEELLKSLDDENELFAIIDDITAIATIGGDGMSDWLVATSDPPIFQQGELAVWEV